MTIKQAMETMAEHRMVTLLRSAPWAILGDVAESSPVSLGVERQPHSIGEARRQVGRHAAPTCAS
jgi:hypothetical protein